MRIYLRVVVLFGITLISLGCASNDLMYGGASMPPTCSRDQYPAEYGNLPPLTERELIKPEEEITMVVSVFHFFENYEILNINWVEWWHENNPGRPNAYLPNVWGWSDCERQPEHNYAACDIYSIRPEYVRADMAMDTIGHEVYHGVVGEFHE